jgi:hypothetical protein
MKREIVSFGCSFVRYSIDNENPQRENHGATPPRPLKQKHAAATAASRREETSFSVELAEMLGTNSINRSVGGSGIRSAVYKVLQYIEENDVDNSFLIIGITEFVRFDFIRPSIIDKWPKLPKEEYAKYYDTNDVVFELTTLLKLLTMYLDSKNISHLFINTVNDKVTTKEFLPTFTFPCGSEFWRSHITSYDITYEGEHPNISDHQILAKYLYDALD